MRQLIAAPVLPHVPEQLRLEDQVCNIRWSQPTTKTPSGPLRSAKPSRPHVDNDSPEILRQKCILGIPRENDGGTGNDPPAISSDVDTVLLVFARRIPRIGVDPRRQVLDHIRRQ